MVDHKGEIVDGDELIYIIARNRQMADRLEGGVVGTLMTNYGAELALQKLDIPFVRAKVGDRYVMEELVKNNWQLGGENSGHIICFDKATTGDATISALQVLIASVDEKEKLHDLKSKCLSCLKNLKNVRIKERTDPMSIMRG